MRSNLLSISRCLLCTIIFILIFAHRSLAQSLADDDIHISAIAEFYSLQVYPHLKGHKALAIGPAGYWTYAYGKPSADAAGKTAMAGCASALHQSTYKSLSKRHCVLVDVNGKRLVK